MKAVQVAFKMLDYGEYAPPMYQQIRCHMIFDIKMDTRAGIVAIEFAGELNDHRQTWTCHRWNCLQWSCRHWSCRCRSDLESSRQCTFRGIHCFQTNPSWPCQPYQSRPSRIYMGLMSASWSTLKDHEDYQDSVDDLKEELGKATGAMSEKESQLQYLTEKTRRDIQKAIEAKHDKLEEAAKQAENDAMKL
eukprot:scaffold73433_cov42-Attheya_sp.AAC.1